MLLNASNLKKSFSERVLFDNVSFTIDAGDRIGFVGANGAVGATKPLKVNRIILMANNAICAILFEFRHNHYSSTQYISPFV